MAVPTGAASEPSDLLSTASASPVTGEAAVWKGTARYEVIGSLGRGAQGVVYEVFDHERQERIALKTLLRFDAADLYRFKREFRTLADVAHPNLVHLHELVAGEKDDLFFTMELVEGTNFLAYVLKQQTARLTSEVVATGAANRGGDSPSRLLSPADFDKLRPALRQLVEGVRALHEAGKLHRDLKPSNVKVTREGRVVILDFGVATELKGSRGGSTADGELVGTVAYMAPEQALGETPIGASDCYSIGSILYEALVGHAPFGGSVTEVLTLKCTTTPLAPSACVQGVPDDLDALCMRLLAIEPEKRPTPAQILQCLGTSASERPAAPEIPAGRDEAALVGREPQVRELRSAFETMREGRSVWVRVSGRLGLGKSALVHHFLDELERGGDVLVLRGRAYERESVPYKAVDSIIDALSRHLIDLQEREVPLTLPRETMALANIFPVLRRIQGVGESPPSPVGDPQVIRQRAFEAVRELFAALTRRQPVVVFIDDVQWGDGDSAALLMELMRPPSTPPLLVTTHRTEQTDTSPFLADVRARWPEDAEVREIEVGPLEFEHARQLASELLGPNDLLARQSAEAIARESTGSPFLIEELAREEVARSASAQQPTESGVVLRAPESASPASGSLTLDDVLAGRVARLPNDARRLLEVIATAGRPIALPTVAAVAGIEDSVAQLVALLQARRFVRTGLRNGLEVVESIHDRIRDFIVAQLPLEDARQDHNRLAAVLEATPHSDPEAIASHLIGAGDKERAAQYAERAAERAIERLAFAQAARLFELTLETRAGSPSDTRRVQRRLAEACEWAGLAEKAARAYLSAAQGAAMLERLDLERAAAAQLLAAGRIDEGGVVLRRVLDAVGRSVPGSTLGIIVGVIAYRVVSLLLVPLARPSDIKDLPTRVRVRLEALAAATRGLAVVDPISAAYVKARYLVDALRSGNGTHIVQAAAGEASTLASAGKRPSKRELALFEMARSLAEKNNDRAAYAIYMVAQGISQYLRGQWRAAVETLDVCSRQLTAARRWAANASVYAVYALGNLGNLREVKSRAMRLIADAEQRGDLYTVVNLRGSHPIAGWLAIDDLNGARRHLTEATALWSKTSFLVQHWQLMLWEAEVALYEGDGARAWERLDRDARPLRRSRLQTVQLIRIFTLYVRGRAAIASLPAIQHIERARRMAEAAAAARQLERESMAWSAPLAAIVRAGHAQASGDADGAEQSLRRAIDLSDQAQMPVHAAAARYQLGLIESAGGTASGDGNPAKNERVTGEETLRACGVRVPERYAQMLVPGPWALSRAR